MKKNKADILYKRFNDFVRGELKRRKQTQADLAEYLNIERTALSHRLCNITPWTFKEVLYVCEFFGKENVSEILF
jgi:transcriptional regulator with XRE-family HTH domain